MLTSPVRIQQLDGEIDEDTLLRIACILIASTWRRTEGRRWRKFNTLMTLTPGAAIQCLSARTIRLGGHGAHASGASGGGGVGGSRANRVKGSHRGRFSLH